MYDQYFKGESERKRYKKRWLIVIVKYRIFWRKIIFDRKSCPILHSSCNYNDCRDFTPNDDRAFNEAS